jgi:NAD(P) transhydrogenase subunit alpha
MKAGSVIVDMATEQGGNCEGSEAGKAVVKNGVTILGDTNLPSRLAVHASQMFSRNMEKLFLHLSKDGALKLDFNEEITKGSVITHDGAVVHAKVKELVDGPALAKGAA